MKLGRGFRSSTSWPPTSSSEFEQRTAEHAATVAQLHEAQKLETLGQLTGGVAHDFNNLLTPITGALDLLQRKYADGDPRSARLLANALQAADRAKTLLQRLLGFARRQALRTEAVDIGALVVGMRELIDSSVGPAIEVQLRCAPDLQPALVDPNQLELAVLNLTVNARDAMPKGGALTILAEEVAIGPGSEPRLTPGLYVRLSVIDAGCGMDAETAAKAIEPFYSTKEFGHGTGLGLSMVHGLAAQLGGGFALTSKPGEGTRVDLYLPVARDVAAAQPRRATDPVRSVGRRLSVLLVDDEDIVRAATADMIRDLGHDVEEVGSGAEALQQTRRRVQGRRPRYRLHDARNGRRPSRPAGRAGLSGPADPAHHRLHRPNRRRSPPAAPCEAVRAERDRRRAGRAVRR